MVQEDRFEVRRAHELPSDIASTDPMESDEHVGGLVASRLQLDASTRSVTLFEGVKMDFAKQCPVQVFDLG
jgi:hypothetical protein